MAVGVAGSTSVAPPSQSFGALKESVANAVGMGGQPQALSLAGKGINNAIRYLDSRLWSWLLTTQSITLVAGTADYDLSDNFKAPRNTELLDSSGNPKSRLQWDDPKNFGDTWVDRSTNGTPKVYTVFNFHDTTNVSLNVPPTAAYIVTYPTLRLRYYRRLPTFSSDGTAHKIPTEAELFIELYAKWELSATIRPQLTGTYERMWRSQEIALLRSESHSQVRDF